MKIVPELDIKKIKDGMYFMTNDGKCYIKVGNRCSQMIVSGEPILMIDFRQADIKAIFKRDGKQLVKEVEVDYNDC